MNGFTSLKDKDVDKIFKGQLKVYRGKRKGKRSKDGGIIRDVELRAYVGAWDYKVPKAVLEELEGGKINLTWLAKSDNSNITTENGESSEAKFFEAWSEFLNALRRGWDDNKVFRCGVLIKGTCKDKTCGRVHIIKNPCKREWCPDCGVPGSAYHMYLFAKALGYAMEMWRQSGGVGYFVITCPLELREQWKDKEVLNSVASYIQRMLAREGFPYGYMKWHFAGDENPGKWYPHLNVLVPGGYLTPEKLERIKNLIYNHLGVKVVHYEYATDPERIIHMVYYITRPTWNMQVEVESKGWSRFRKSRIWGKKYFKKARMWREFLRDLNHIKRERGEVKLNVVLMDLREMLDPVSYEQDKEELDLREMLGPVSYEQEIEDFPEDKEELILSAIEVWYVKEALREGKCSRCGGEIKWEGVIRDLDNEYINGEVFRIGWNMWVIDKRQYPKEENEENKENARSP